MSRLKCDAIVLFPKNIKFLICKEKEGYYYVECNNYEISWFGFPEEVTDGKAIREAEGYFISGSDIEKKAVFKLNAGETVFGIDFNDEAYPEDICKVKIEYLGDAVTDITFDENAFDNLILEVDLYNTDASYIGTDVNVVFSLGKTIAFPDEWIQIDDEDHNWVKGENNATANFMGFRKNVVVTACEMSDLITDVEFVNFGKYKNVVTDFNDYYAEDIYGAELVFTLADGEKISVNTDCTDYIEINGREYYTYTAYIYNNAEDVDIEIVVGGVEIAVYECEAAKSSYIDGSEKLFNCIGKNLKDSFFYSRVAFSEFLRIYDAGELEDAFYDASYYFSLSFTNFINCFSLIGMFMSYYF